MSETRVVGAQARKIGGGSRPPTAPEPAAPAEPAAAPQRGRGRLVVVVLVLLAVAGAGAFFLLRPTESPAAAEETEPEPGMSVLVEPRNINLAGGHYLRMGFAVELVAEAEEIPTAQATDIAIALFSGRTVEEVNDPEQRAELKTELTQRLVEAYGEEVRTVYLTDFVTQ